MIKSAGGIVYYIDEEGQPRFLILKRHALSKKIEWVAPKGKIKENELPDQAAIREVYEETGIHPNFIENQGHIGDLEIHLESEDRGKFDKIISYYLLKYSGDPNKVQIASSEGYLGIYKWANINEVLNLVSYQRLRELFFKAYQKIIGKN